jgi:hypothetical protein
MKALERDLVRRRLRNQRLDRSEFRKPADVVRWLGAVQAQDYAGAKWALGLRAKGLTDADADRALDEGTILRTHILRPTWHFVIPADIRWMLALTAPRVHAANAHTYREFELDASVFRRSRKELERALRGGKERTRAELASVLRRGGIAAKGIRLAALMIEAELEGVIVSGPRRGKQFTYALLEERAHPAGTIGREEALAELTKRYFSSHGPATLRDYVWWSGLTVGDAKAGIEIVESELDEEVLDGRTCWFVGSRAPAPSASTSAHLLPNYDEYLIAYKDRGPVVGASGQDVFSHFFVIAGRLAGSWRRTLKKDSVLVEAVPYRRLSRADTRALAHSAERYGRFLGRTAQLVVQLGFNSHIQPSG